MDPQKDKENRKVKTKIPLPVAPLPALSQHLLKKLNDRLPLHTIVGPNRLDQNKQSRAGPSIAKNKLTGNRPKLVLKFVTVKRGSKEYSDKYTVRKDKTRKRSKPSVIYISSSDDEQERNETPPRTDKYLFSCRLGSPPRTPALQTSQSVRVKNIKCSINRLNSIELEGISPLSNQDKSEQSKVGQLCFNISVDERMVSPDSLQRSYMETMDRDYTSDVLSYLLQAETKPLFPPRIRSETRTRLMNWLMKINILNGNPATIQIAMWYFDSVSISRHLTVKNMRLVAIASYWIATKIQGLQIPASKLANNATAVRRLLEAEKIILQRLQFPRQPVVAQEFLCYFAWRFNKDWRGQIEVAATFVCLCGMLVNNNLYQEFPSVVAAASIRNALLLLKITELMPELLSCTEFVAAERKTSNIFYTCDILRQAVRTVVSEDYAYKFILEQYGVSTDVAQTFVSAAEEVAILETGSSAAMF